MTAVKEKELSFNEVNSFSNELATSSFKELEDGVRLLEQARALRNQFEAAAQSISSQLLEMFNQECIEEFYYKDKLVKPGYSVSYDYSKLETLLPNETRQKIIPYLPLKLNRAVIEQAINDQILSVQAFEEFIKAGLVERNVKHFIKFCDPQLEEKRLQRLNEEI